MATQRKSLSDNTHELLAELSAPVREVREGLEVIILDSSWLEEVYLLEQRCYPAPWSRELVARELAKTEVAFRPGLLLDGHLVAQAFNYIVGDELHVLNIAVNPSFRRQGFGAEILNYILYHSILQGVALATLEVRPSNRAAQQLYRSFGFKLAGIRRRYYNDNGEDALVLERRLARSDIAGFRRRCSITF